MLNFNSLHEKVRAVRALNYDAADIEHAHDRIDLLAEVVDAMLAEMEHGLMSAFREPQS